MAPCEASPFDNESTDRAPYVHYYCRCILTLGASDDFRYAINHNHIMAVPGNGSCPWLSRIVVKQELKSGIGAHLSL